MTKEISFSEAVSRMGTSANKLKTLKESYRIKINALEAKRSFLTAKSKMAAPLSFVPNVSNKIDKDFDEIEELNNKISDLKAERDASIREEKDKYEKYKTMVKKTSKGGKIENSRDFIAKYKWQIAFAFALFIVLDIVYLWWTATDYNRENDRDYYIKADQAEYVFDCNLSNNSDDELLNCADREVSGTFSLYDTVVFDDESDYIIKGDTFSKKIRDHIYSYEYETDDFNLGKIDRIQKRTTSIKLKNTRLGKIVAEKEIEILYNLTDADLGIIQKRHDAWAEKEKNKAEERKKREEEQKKAEEAKKKAKEEEERKKAEEERKKAAEEKKASSKPSIDAIADACWAYGRNHGVHLTDYASDDINQDGDYYQIMMYHDDGSYWRCWYNPSNKDVFVEKAYNNPWR